MKDRRPLRRLLRRALRVPRGLMDFQREGGGRNGCGCGCGLVFGLAGSEGSMGVLVGV